jgi:integrase
MAGNSTQVRLPMVGLASPPASGLTGVRLHDVRHAVATAYARSVARPSVTAAILGHATQGFTSKVYEHPDEAMLREAAEAAAKLDALDQ